jgi:hypothetical protein
MTVPSQQYADLSRDSYNSYRIGIAPQGISSTRMPVASDTTFLKIQQ